MPVFGAVTNENLGAAKAEPMSPLAVLFRQYPGLQEYAGQLGLTTGPETLYGYQTTPPMLFRNQPRSGVSTIANTPPILEGVDPSAGESLTAQMASGNANLGASVGLELERGRTGPLGHRPSGVGPPVGLPATPPPTLVSQPSAPAAPAPAPAAPVTTAPLAPGSPSGVPLPGGSGAGAPDAGSAPGAGDGGGVGAPTGSGQGVGTGPGGAPGAAGPGIGEGGSGPGSGVGGPGSDAGGGAGSAGGVGTGPGGAPGAAGPGIGEGGSGGGAGGGAGGGTVICTVLHERGYMDDRTWVADAEFGDVLHRVCPDALRGYHRWARPLAKLMRRSALVTRVVALLATPWAQEMAYVVGARPKGNRLGRFLMTIGLPLCVRLGR